MSIRIPSRYLGNFHHRISGERVTFMACENPTRVRYKYNGNEHWIHDMVAIQWTAQVDAGIWVSDIPEYLQVSEGL